MLCGLGFKSSSKDSVPLYVWKAEDTSRAQKLTPQACLLVVQMEVQLSQPSPSHTRGYHNDNGSEIDGAALLCSTFRSQCLQGEDKLEVASNARWGGVGRC